MGMGGATVMAAVEVCLDLRPLLSLTRVAEDGIVSAGGGGGEDRRVEDCVVALEEERRKIEAFRRELPLCMAIVSDVIERLREEVSRRRNPVLEQLFPAVERDDIEVVEQGKEADISKDKMNWMSSVQLWGVDSANGHANPGSAGDAKTTKECSVDKTFLPFKVVSDEKSTWRKGDNALGRPVLAQGPDLSLHTPGIMCSSEETSPFESRLGGEVMRLNLTTSPPLLDLQLEQQQQQQHGPRKVRRCWSPELHRRFVSALQQLGGSEVATPKQIRELMKVDGLTNDEVKSHLQKYRLHTRRVSSAAANRNTTVFGELCARSTDHYFGSKMSTSQGSPKGPLELATTAVTYEDSCEDNDGKSESHSWRGYTHRSGEVETF